MRIPLFALVVLLTATACLFQPPLLAEGNSNSHLERAKEKIQSIRGRLPRSNEIDTFFDGLLTEIARGEYQYANKIQELDEYAKKLKEIADNRKQTEGSANAIDAVFFALLDDSQAQDQILKNAISVAESNDIEALRIMALTVLAMNGEAARQYTTRIGNLAQDSHPFRVRFFAVFALGEVNPASSLTRQILSDLLSSKSQHPSEDRVLQRAAISAIGKGREHNGDLAKAVLSTILASKDSSIVNSGAFTLAELSTDADESIAQLYKFSGRPETSLATLESVARLARLAQSCDTLAILQNSQAASKALPNYFDLEPLFEFGIENLDSHCLESQSWWTRMAITAWRWFRDLSLLNQVILILALIVSGQVVYLLSLTACAPHKVAEKSFPLLAARNDDQTQAENIKELATTFFADPSSLILKALVIPWLLLRWLGSTSFVTTRWVRKFRPQLLEQAFLGRASVANRTRYLDIGEIEKHLEHSEFRKAIWIHGPGGSGKSTLAFKMAMSIASATDSVAIPVVIDDEWESNLLKFVASNFRPTADHPHVPEFILRKLIRKGKILLVFDGISERTTLNCAPSQFARQLILDLDPRKVIFTSRDGNSPIESYPIALGPIDGERLDLFIEGLVTPPKIMHFHESLMPLRGSGPIAPLFVELAAQRFNAGQSIPSSYPDLVSRCVEALDPGPDVTRGDFLELTRVAAYICIDEISHTPKATSRGDFTIRFSTLLHSGSTTLEKLVPADQGLQVLTATGLMRCETTLARKRWSFSNDPFCEYLAALYIVEAKTWFRESTCHNEALINAVKETLQVGQARGLYSTDEQQDHQDSSTRKTSPRGNKRNRKKR